MLGVRDTGQTGNTGNIMSPTPVIVAGLGRNVNAVSVGGDHTCALLEGGTVKCWGWNSFGQLGNGQVKSSYVPGSLIPVNVIGITNAISISSGDDHSCAVLKVRKIKCWGDNRSGQLGNGTTSKHSEIPVEVIDFE